MSQGYGDRFQQLEQRYNEYTVYDHHYEKVGKVADIFVDENDEPEYIGVKMGLFGTKSTLVPIEIVRVNDRRQLIEIAADEDTIKHAPTFDNDSDITPDYEDRVHGYFGLQPPSSVRGGYGGYGGYYDSATYPDEGLGSSAGTGYGGRSGIPEYPAVGTPSGGTGSANLDIPLEDAGREEAREDIAASSQPRSVEPRPVEPRPVEPRPVEPRPAQDVAASSQPRRVPASSQPRRMPDPQPSGSQVGGDGSVRIYKRTRPGPR